MNVANVISMDGLFDRLNSEEAFAEHIIDECYDLIGMMGSLHYYFDYKTYARDLFIDDYYFTDGYVFRRC